ncbi:EAL domain-containing protein [Thioalkalivibrio sulfidiphilus]|uniref:EAL domain-containing protein n=1 Tax=Thioalkalivibrio sulfidiphilus TaxID=1033854 RepID=UPI001E2D0199|nr:EAL domain-containing protein [Thioalkalivibrio sulfidiphilus]
MRFVASAGWLRIGLMWLGLVVASSAADAREVRVGVYDNAPKLMLEADGTITGILGDLLREMAQEEDWRLVPVSCEWSRCLELLSRGELDLLPDVAYSEERAARMDFHRVPALYSWSQVYQGPGARIDSMLDLEGRSLAVLEGSIQQGFLMDLLDNFGVRVSWLPVQTLQEGFDRVIAGEADAVVANHRFGDQRALEMGLRVTPIMFQPVQLFYAAPRGRNADLLARIDAHLTRWKDTPGSVYFDILRSWGFEHTETRIPEHLWWGLAGLLAALGLALLFSLFLRLQVNERTRQLRASEERLSTILNSVEACIYIKDTELRYQYANRKLCELFSASPERIIGRRDADFFDAETAARLEQNDRLVLERGERFAEEEHNRTRDGRHVNTFLTVKLPLRHADGSIHALCGISTDISEQKKILEEVHQLAFFDPLTGLPNRRLLIDQLRHALANCDRTGHEGALLFIDLDNFKNLNDTLGHDMGDLLLQQIAERLREHVRENDSLARLGGDEFVVMLEGLQPEGGEAVHQVRHVGEKLLGVLSEPFSLDRVVYRITASIGVAMFSDSDDTVEELLKRADLAMYEAKSAGRNGLRFFNPSMQAAVSARAALEADLREALQTEQFFLDLQPQVDAAGTVVGAEALLRWRHPERGLVSPGEFIPVAEATGMILPLGDWVLRQACDRLAAWSRDPEMAGLVLAINVSVRQFRHPDFVSRVQDVLEDSGADPRRLEMELTESQLVDNVEDMIGIMMRLRARGVRFSLDDFGTGYSSLSYLKRLPLDQLKIDQSFVRDLLVDSNDEAIVRTVVALGESLDLRVIAEGVEREAQRDKLLALGCRYFQGYLYGRPGPAGALSRCVAREA